MYLISAQGDHHAVVTDFGMLADPESGDPIRVLMVEPGANSARECIWSFRQRSDGTLYQVDDGGNLEFMLAEELPEDEND